MHERTAYPPFQQSQLTKMSQVTTFPVYLDNGGPYYYTDTSPVPMPVHMHNGYGHNGALPLRDQSNAGALPLRDQSNAGALPLRDQSNAGALPLRDQSNTTANNNFLPMPLYRDHNNNIVLLPQPPPPVLLEKGVDESAQVGATQFRVGQLLHWMIQQKADPSWMELARKRKLLDVKVHQISGIGFLSYIYRIEFCFEGTKTPFTAILKVPSIINLSVFSKEDEFLSNWAYKLSERHNKEIFCYEHFGRRIEAAGIVHVPKLYHAACADTPKELEQGCILMEDLDRLGIMGNTVLGLNRAQVEALIRALARIHALSLAVPGSELLLEQLRFKFSLDEEDGQAKFNAIRALIGTGHDYWKRHGQLLMQIAGQHELMLHESHKQFGVPPVLCHGDMWANNVFFERRPDDTPGDELYAIIDWQFSHPSSGLQDLARLILLCVNSSLKLYHLDDWLVLYFDTFAEGCRKWGVRCPYSMDLVRRMFMVHYPSEMLFSMLILMNHYTKLDNEGLKTALLGRMISSFEWLRQKMRQIGTDV